MLVATQEASKSLNYGAGSGGHASRSRSPKINRPACPKKWSQTTNHRTAIVACSFSTLTEAVKAATLTSCGHRLTVRAEKAFALTSPKCYIWYFKCSITLVGFCSFPLRKHMWAAETEPRCFAKGRLAEEETQASDPCSCGLVSGTSRVSKEGCKTAVTHCWGGLVYTLQSAS